MTGPLSDNDTIFALASAHGRAGVAVFRVSGPQAFEAVRALCHPSGVPEPRKAVRRYLVDPKTQDKIDHAVVLWFPAPGSYTGEPVVEFQVHGGRAIVNDLTEALGALQGFRLAEPGEFTRRAFENGKMDLIEAEAVADLVDAETSAQRKQALRQLDGELGKLYHGWADRLKRRLAYIEADIDFVEEDLPEEVVNQTLDDLRVLLSEIEGHLNDHRRGERLREGFMVAIVGPPNAGKSSLLNALTRREAAIVTSTPGTTRDIIEVHLDIGGYPVTLADTAGLRDSLDSIENEGVRRALARAGQADLKIVLFDGAVWPDLDAKTNALVDDDTLVVVNKTDLIKQRAPVSGRSPLFISTLTGEGLNDLTNELKTAIDARFPAMTTPALTRARHRQALEICRDHLERALKAPEVELCAEDARLAMRALGRITGTVDVEDLLDVIFSEFCIGK